MQKKDELGYLTDFLDRILRIEAYSQSGRDSFFGSELLQDAIIRNFEIMGEIVKRLDRVFTDQYPEIPWRRIAGFRDVLIHNYEAVSVNLVWQVIEDDLQPLKANIKFIIADLEQRSDDE